MVMAVGEQIHSHALHPVPNELILFRWINIYSLPLFFRSITGALNVRLSRVIHVLGANYSAELRIAELRTSVEGVIIKISNCQIESVAEYKLSNQDLLASGKYTALKI